MRARLLAGLGLVACSSGARRSEPTSIGPVSPPPVEATPVAPSTTPPPAPDPRFPKGVLARLGESPRHGDQIVEIAWSPTGARFATSAEKNVRVWSAAGVLEGEIASSAMTKLAFSPDGTLLAGANSSVTVWDATTRKERWSISLEGDDVDDLAFSPDGLDLAIGSENHENHHLGAPPSTGLWLRDVETGMPLRRFEFEDGAHAVAFSPDGKTFAYAPGAIHLLQRGRTKPFAQISGSASQLAFSPDGKTLFADGGYEKPLRRIDVASRRARPIKGVVASAFAVAPDGKQLAAITEGGLSIVDLATDRVVATIPEASTMAYAPNGKLTVAVGSQPRHLEPGATALPPSPGHDRPISRIACAADGGFVATASEDGTVRLWDLTGKPRAVIVLGSPARAVALSPDGSRVITASAGQLAWWNAATGASTATVKLAATDVVALRDGRIISTSGSELQVWTTDGGSPERRVPVPDGNAITIAASADGARLWVGGSGKSAIWSTATWTAETKIDSSGENGVFSADGSTIAIDHGIYQTSTGARVSFGLVGSKTRDIAISRDGKWIAVAFWTDGTIYNAAGDPERTWRRFDAGTPGAATAVEFCSGDTLVAGYNSGELLVWAVGQIPDEPPPKK
jgi:WD40 repeat protein